MHLWNAVGRARRSTMHSTSSACARKLRQFMAEQRTPRVPQKGRTVPSSRGQCSREGLARTELPIVTGLRRWPWSREGNNWISSKGKTVKRRSTSRWFSFLHFVGHQGGRSSGVEQSTGPGFRSSCSGSCCFLSPCLAATKPGLPG